MKRLKTAALLFFLSGPALAHFQILYTPDLSRDRGQLVELVLAFSHPAHGGPNMDMGTPSAFYVLSQRGDDGAARKTDLMEFLEPIRWRSHLNESAGYRAKLPRTIGRSMGDYVFVLTPSPYYEASEDKYIQQFTKTIMNVGGIPGNWDQPVGLPAEIRPLDKPYTNWTGGVFRGVVLGAGKPVPFAEIEVEYMNYPIVLDQARFGAQPRVVYPRETYGTLSIRADGDGEFTIGLPRAGWWGIGALDVGPTEKFEGKPLSQDGVLWIEVRDMAPAPETSQPTSTTP